MTINNKYNLGDFVYLLTDPDQKVRIVTALYVRTTGIEYGVRCGSEESWHFEVELSTDKKWATDF